MRQLEALQRDVGNLHQGIDSLHRDLAALKRLQKRGEELAAGQAFLASPLQKGATAALLARGSYRTRAAFLKELFAENWELLLKSWTKGEGAEKYLDIDGVRLTAEFPDKNSIGAIDIFMRSFFVYLFFEDDYVRDIVLPVEQVVRHVRQYVDDCIDVRIKPGDTVIDAGAWIGDFSAYAVKKGAIVHAFEPTKTTYELLLHTVDLNGNNIIPVMKGLGAEKGVTEFMIYQESAADNRVVREGIRLPKDARGEKSSIEITTLDSYVEEKNLQKVDFIKADIEGTEDYLLDGSTNTLRKFAPKLSIATYHSRGDIELVHKAILRANPTYQLVQCRTAVFGEGKPIEA